MLKSLFTYCKAPFKRWLFFIILALSTKLSSLETIVLALNFLLIFFLGVYVLTLCAGSMTTSFISSSSQSKRWTFLSHSSHDSPDSSPIPSIRILFLLDLLQAQLIYFLCLSDYYSNSLDQFDTRKLLSGLLLLYRYLTTTFATLSSRSFCVSFILFFNSSTSFFKLLISFIVISRLPLIILAKFGSCFLNSSSKTFLISFVIRC